MANKSKKVVPQSNPEGAYIGMETVLQNAGWVYKGCGYWIDPVTSCKHMTDNACAIQQQREKNKR